MIYETDTTEKGKKRERTEVVLYLVDVNAMAERP